MQHKMKNRIKILTNARVKNRKTQRKKRRFWLFFGTISLVSGAIGEGFSGSISDILKKKRLILALNSEWFIDFKPQS